MGFVGRVERKEFSSYQVILSEDFESGRGRIIVKQGKKILFEEADCGSHYYFGNHFDESLNPKDIYSGKNITGNRIVNLLISNWTGGAHC